MTGARVAAAIAMQLESSRAPVTRGERRGARERAGLLVGALWAPAVAAIARARRTRMFHPAGHAYIGTCTVLPGRYERLGRQLAGHVLARFSGALWKREVAFPEVLGLALRFRGDRDPATEQADPRDQDLLTATIRSPLTMLISPLVTDASDFVDQTYWAVSPFAYAGERFELRLHPLDRARRGASRVDRLDAAVAAEHARWCLEARPTLHVRWHPVARIDILRPVTLDHASLFFDPFRGVLRPVGLVHAIRHATYAASQRTRAALGHRVTEF